MKHGKDYIELDMMIKEIARIVEEACKKKTNYFGYGIWKHHILNVVKYSILMAKKIGADKEIVEIAALLHDYASVKNYKLYESGHHIHGARMAEELLKKFNYPQEKIEQVKHCILSHSGDENCQVKRKTKEAICVANADAMAHFSAIPSLFYLAFFSHKMNIDEATDFLMAKLERSWNKLSPEGKEIIRDKYEASKKLFGELVENNKRRNKKYD